MAIEKQRRAFISYSHVNRDFAIKLAKALRAAEYAVWFDQLDIPAAHAGTMKWRMRCGIAPSLWSS